MISAILKNYDVLYNFYTITAVMDLNHMRRYAIRLKTGKILWYQSGGLLLWRKKGRRFFRWKKAVYAPII